MADFSKQYCDKYDPGFPHDFDLDEEYEKLKNGENLPCMCEGLGFTHIHKTEEGVKQVVFTNWAEDGDDYKFINLDEVTDKTYKTVFVEG